MRMFMVRLVENKEPVGLFWAENLERLWWDIDEVTDPGQCEYVPIDRPVAVIWPDPMDGATIGEPFEADEATGESSDAEEANLEAVRAGVQWSEAMLDYVMGLLSRSRWKKLPYFDEGPYQKLMADHAPS